MQRRGLGWIFTILVLVGAILFVRNADRKRDEADKRRAEVAAENALIKAAALSVTDLPPGVQARWERYADEGFEGTISVENGQRRIGEASTAYISMNTPYRISCDGLSVTVVFGEGEDAPQARVIEGPGGGLNSLIAAPRLKAEGLELGVDPESIAAKKLGEMLCARVSKKMQLQDVK